MILIDNINVLRENSPATWDMLRKYEEVENRELFTVEDTRGGDKTLFLIKDDKKVYLHSKYNPLKEAEMIMESYGNINEDSHIIFYGTGLGHHIKFILEKYPNIKYYIHEPIAELMYNCLSNINLKELKVRRLLGMNVGLDSDSNLSEFVDLNRDKLIIVELPSHKQNFPEEYKIFSENFLSIIKGKRGAIATDYSFQKRWIKNSMKNFGEVLSTPNIMIQKKGKFKDKPAILVAAGPSLNDEIENLRYIKENGLAYIFSVGSAISTLIHHGIYPDAACTYDPTTRTASTLNQEVFQVVKEEKIKEIPLIFGSSVGYETLLNYPGNKYHMITSQDTVASYYLRDQNNQAVDIVLDAPSIAIITLQLLHQLDFNPIVLVGQNLAYRGKERYSEGIAYSSDVTQEEIERGIWVKDVEGNDILTDEGFKSMGMQMEYYIKEVDNIEVINATKGGAHIEGTKFVELSDVMAGRMQQKIVEENWLEESKLNYSKEYLMGQLQKMDSEYDRAQKMIREYYSVLGRTDKLINNRNFNQAEKMYIKLKQELIKIENNDYYKIFILPMNRVEHKMLIDGINSLGDVRDPYQKGKEIMNTFRNFINVCNKDMKMIEASYNEIREVIMNYSVGGE